MSSPTVFISYSHKDKLLKDELTKYLRVYEKQLGQLIIWDDSLIEAGTDWRPKIKEIIDNATVAILIITIDFLHSEFIRTEEIPPMLTRRQNDGLVIIPIIARECPWKAIDWLGGIQARPVDGRPIWRGNEESIASDLTEIASEVYKIVTQFNASTYQNGQLKNNVIRVLIADDQTIAVEGIRKIVEQADDMTVVATAQTKLDVLKYAEQEQPDVIVLDLDWHRNRKAGDELIKQLKQSCPNSKIAAVTNYEELMDSANRLGAFPLLKSVSKIELQQHIRYVAQAEAKKLGNHMDMLASFEPLTPRETEVLRLITNGSKDLAIASELNIAVGTVKKHVGHILSKLNASSRTQAAIIAERHNLL